MEIKYTATAFEFLNALVNFIESHNTAGAGLRWFNKYQQFLRNSLSDSARKRICQNATFNRLNLRCIYFNDWLMHFPLMKIFSSLRPLFINQG